MKTLLLQKIEKQKGEIQQEAWSAYIGACRNTWWNNEKIKIKKIEQSKLKFDKLKSIPIGSITFVKKYANLHSIVMPEITYDHKYFSDKIYVINYESLLKLKFPVFVKPVLLKSINGEVYQNVNELQVNLKGVDYASFYVNEKLYDFESEYRIYVHKKIIKNISRYQGNIWDTLWNRDIVENFVADCKYNTYSFDIGFDKISQTWIPIEINDFWSLGNYGMNHEDYYLAIRDRWEEIILDTKLKK